MTKGSRRPGLPWPLLLLLGVLAFGVGPAIASYGDNSPPFRACLAACLGRCAPSPDVVTTSSAALVLTHWTCSDECKYDCMTELTEGQLQHQFYGKWPFRRCSLFLSTFLPPLRLCVPALRAR